MKRRQENSLRNGNFWAWRKEKLEDLVGWVKARKTGLFTHRWSQADRHKEQVEHNQVKMFTEYRKGIERNQKLMRQIGKTQEYGVSTKIYRSRLGRKRAERKMNA